MVGSHTFALLTSRGCAVGSRSDILLDRVYGWIYICARIEFVYLLFLTCVIVLESQTSLLGEGTGLFCVRWQDQAHGVSILNMSELLYSAFSVHAAGA